MMAWIPFQAQAQTNVVPVPITTQEGKDTPWICLLVLFAAAAGTAVIIYAYTTTCNECRNKRLVLEMDHCDDNWRPIATNIVGAICTNKYEVFREQMVDPICRYRVKVYPID